MSDNKKPPQLIHDPSSIYFLHPSEGPGMILTKYVLTGDNYDVWAKAILNGLEGKNKQGFVNDEFVQPTEPKSNEMVAWRANNSTICGWMFNSIDVSIQPSVASHKIAKDMWIDLKERYATSNGPRIHQLKSQLHSLQQKGMNVVTYYNKFKELWDALYGSDDVTCGCTCTAAAKIRAKVEDTKTHDFLMGLEDAQYRAIRTQILGMEPFPTLNKAFSMVTQEERHKSIIRGRDDKTDVLSFATQYSSPTVARTNPPIQQLVCTYCGKLNHDYEHCFQRLGYPDGGRGRGKVGGRGRGRGASAQGRGQHSSVPTTAAAQVSCTTTDGDSSSQHAHSSTISGFTSEQMQRLLTLLDSSPPSEKLYGPHIEDPDWAG